MIKLTSKNKLHNISFYFNNIEDCNKFLYVFKNHWCNVKWEKPEEIPNNTYIKDYHKRYLGRPEELAENNLKWGFNSFNDDYTTNNDNFTQGQLVFSRNMVERIK